MSRYENEYDDEHDNDRDDDRDDHATASNPVSTSTGSLSNPVQDGYQFTISNNQVTALYEVEHGRVQQKAFELGETWQVNGAQVIKTEISHGYTETSIYADANRDGIFTKISQAYSNSGTSSSTTVSYATSGSDSDDSWAGSTGNDDYYAAAGDDDLRGGSGTDRLGGDFGNDHLEGGAGDDHLDGGAGDDYAVYRGLSSEYSITRDASGALLVQDFSRDRDGSDTLSNVERVKFADTVLAFDTAGNAGQAYRLYKAAFDRTPDDVGLGGWIKHLDGGATLSSAADGFMASAEFMSKYGTHTSNDEFVNLLYRNALHREADAAGHDGWVGGLNGGMSRSEVLVAFSESAENQAQTIGLVGNGIHYQEWIG